MHFSRLRELHINILNILHIKHTKHAPLMVPPQQQRKEQLGPCISHSELKAAVRNFSR